MIMNKQITDILVSYYNVIIPKGFYSSQWLKVLNIILDKGKGPVLGKLRTIQLIEADLQLIMRIFLGLRYNKRLEEDTRVSKFNFRSRKGYSINKVILEKSLIYNTSMWTRKPTVHVVTNLQACYDR